MSESEATPGEAASSALEVLLGHLTTSDSQHGSRCVDCLAERDTIRAVTTCHDELVAALESTLEAMRELRGRAWQGERHRSTDPLRNRCDAIDALASAALAKARSKT